LTNYDKSILFKLNSLGNKIRQTRESKGLLLRQAAAFLEVDTALVSKLERGERRAQKDQVVKLAKFLEIDANELLVLWIADKLMDLVAGEKLAEEALGRVMKEIRNSSNVKLHNLNK
jgi:transcriptional regulator with XRE-family HTH domain